MRTAILVLVLLLQWTASSQAQRIAFVVRHAERADDAGGGAAMLARGQDPPLSAAGRERAERLARHLRDAGVTAIYVTQYVRTQQTAEPLARALGLKPTQIENDETDDLVRDIRSRYAAGVVLVVGHSSTVPVIVKALGGGEVEVQDDEYDALFIVARGAGGVVVRY